MDKKQVDKGLDIILHDVWGVKNNLTGLSSYKVNNDTEYVKEVGTILDDMLYKLQETVHKYNKDIDRLSMMLELVALFVSSICALAISQKIENEKESK